VFLVAASDTVAIAASAFSAAVAIAVAFITNQFALQRDRDRERTEERRLDKQQRIKRGDELRSVVDESASALTQALFAYSRRSVADSREVRHETGAAFDDAVMEVSRCENAIRLRVGTSRALFGSYQNARREFDCLSRLAWKAGEDVLGERDDAKAARKKAVAAIEQFLKDARSDVREAGFDGDLSASS
jgi:hypothetical protein